MLTCAERGHGVARHRTHLSLDPHFPSFHPSTCLWTLAGMLRTGGRLTKQRYFESTYCNTSLYVRLLANDHKRSRIASFFVIPNIQWPPEYQPHKMQCPVSRQLVYQTIAACARWLDTGCGGYPKAPESWQAARRGKNLPRHRADVKPMCAQAQQL